MKRYGVLAAVAGILAACCLAGASAATADDTKGRNCRMEQQCHWVNFKKICTWIKVCR